MNILKSTLIESTKKDQKGQKAVIAESSMTDDLLLPLPTKERRPRGPNKKKSLSLSALSELTTEESSHLLLALSQKQPKIQTERKQASAKAAAKEAAKAAKAAKAAAKEAKMSVSTLASLSGSNVSTDMPILASGGPFKTKKSKSSGIKLTHSPSLIPPNVVQSEPIISTWDLCSFIVKRLHTDVTNFKYNLKRKVFLLSVYILKKSLLSSLASRALYHPTAKSLLCM